MLMCMLLFLILVSTVCIGEKCIGVKVDEATEGKIPGLNTAIIEALVQEGFELKADPSKKYLENIKSKMATAGILRFGRSLKKDVRPTVQPNWRKETFPYAQSVREICAIRQSAVDATIFGLDNSRIIQVTPNLMESE